MIHFADAVAITAIFAITAVMLRMWLGHRERMTGLSRLKKDDGRLERVEQAVEAIAIEIERVSEGQRFVTKMLNDRAQPLSGSAPVPGKARQVDEPR